MLSSIWKNSLTQSDQLKILPQKKQLVNSRYTIILSKTKDLEQQLQDHQIDQKSHSSLKFNNKLNTNYPISISRTKTFTKQETGSVHQV